MIVYAFDHHACTECRDAERAHEVDQIAIDGAEPPAFELVCLTCGDRSGPFGGEPWRRAPSIAAARADAPESTDTGSGRSPHLGGEDSGGGMPWNANEGKYDRPTSSVPRPSSPAATRARERHRQRRTAGPGIHVRMADDAMPDDAFAGMPLLEATPSAIAEAEAAALEPERASGPAEHGMAKVLLEIIERRETLLDRRAAIAEDLRELMAFAKAIGLDGPAITQVTKDRAADPDKRKEREANIAVYRHALRVEGPDFAAMLPDPPPKLPVRKRAITAKDKAYNDVGAWLAATGVAS